MTSAIAILERLLNEKNPTPKEHVLERASRHVSNVEDRFQKQFDRLAEEISATFGVPDFSQDKLRGSMPKWYRDTTGSSTAFDTIRLSFWKRPSGTCYIALKSEVDRKKNINLYYNLVLGAHPKPNSPPTNVKKLRSAKEHWLSKVQSIFTDF